MTIVHEELGQVRRTGETVELVFRRRFARPIEKVWAALTVPERLADWFADTKVDRLEPGGRIEFFHTGADYRSLGRVVAYEPPRLFAWTWSELDGSKESLVRFELEPDGDGCRLTLTHSGLPPEDGEGVLAGWHAHLEAVEDAADGVFTPWDKLMEREGKVAPLYKGLVAA